MSPDSARRDSSPTSATELLRWFERTAYVRSCDPGRRLREGQAYKKGYEVRFVLTSRDEVREVRRLIRAVGLRPGKTYAKINKIVQPVYGAAALDWFLNRLPPGRQRESMGFSPSGQRVVRRSRSIPTTSRTVR